MARDPVVCSVGQSFVFVQVSCGEKQQYADLKSFQDAFKDVSEAIVGVQTSRGVRKGLNRVLGGLLAMFLADWDETADEV